ncbi:MAG: tRNA guanosine(34) transglycosylase Tgt [bacterium]
MSENNVFHITKNSEESKARAGYIITGNGVIETPVFMPVGTQGTVKAIEQRELEELNTRIILGNTYHLYLRPGDEVINHFGGLHRFINWDRPILTDSGGYQVFSLQDLRKLTEDGVEFKSHIDGSKHFFSPEKVVDIQRNLGSDIMMVLDECTQYPATKQDALKSMEISEKWASRTKKQFENTQELYGHKQLLFSIGQGSMYKDLRQDYIQKMLDIEFDGYAIGGLSVGEPAEMMYEMTDISTDILPSDKPRYLMGVGTPENILESISLGIDMFDCVLPTRNARNGQLFTSRGKINIRNSKYKLSDEAIDENIDSYASKKFSLGYLRHLFIANEILGLQLATIHNIAFYLWLVEKARFELIHGDFTIWKKEMIQALNRSDE